MRQCTGFPGGGFALLNEIHTLGLFPIEHESVHILFNSSVAYTNSQFFAEGVTQYFEHSRDTTVYLRDLEIVRKNLNQPIKDWINGTKNFWDSPKDDWITVTYPISGVFVRFLIDKYGLKAFKDFYKTMSGPSNISVADAFQNAFDSNLGHDISEFVASN